MKNESVTTILTGGFPPLNSIMNEQSLESMVTHLVQCTCNSAIDCPKGNEKELARLEDIPFRQPIATLRDEDIEAKTSSMAWNSILKDLFARCPQFCRDELVNIPRPLINARWRESSDRKVLAPLALKENTDNIIAGSLDMSRKRKSEVTKIWTPPKRVKFDDSLKPCSVVIKRAPLKVLLLQFRCVNNRSFVKLYDILKEIPQEKEEEIPVTQNEYMGFLGLDSREPADQKQYPEVKTGHPIKLVSHPNIPFSSDYGRRLLARERHCLPQEVALRKLERTEWYLKGAAAVGRNGHRPEVTFDKRSKYFHTYRFPKRQFYQNHESLSQAFMRYACKPLRIEVERSDLQVLKASIKVVQQEVIEEPEQPPDDDFIDLTKDDDVISVTSTVVSYINTDLSILTSTVTSDDNFSDVFSETASEYEPKLMDINVVTSGTNETLSEKPKLRRSRRLSNTKIMSK